MTAIQDQQHAIGTNLSGELREFVHQYKERSQRNRALNVFLVTMGFALGAATVIAGVFDKGHLAACIASLLAAVVGLDRAFGFDDSHRFQELLVVEGENLQTELTEAVGDANLKRIRRQLHTLKRNAVMSRHGQRMAAVTALYRGAMAQMPSPASLLYQYPTPPAERGPKKTKPPRRLKKPAVPGGEG
jgi:hypothetical protein